ncbi:MAG: substrate-binding periplasmic protein [Desulfococcaceae bacterium]
MNRSTVFLLSFAMIIGLSVTGYAQPRLTVATDDCPPYEFIAEDNNVTGFCTEVIMAVFKQMNVMFDADKIKIYPFARLEKNVLEGDVDAAYSLSFNEKRKAACHFPEESLIDTKWILFIRKKDEGKLIFNTFNDLKNKKIGIVRAYAYTPEFWQFLESEKNYEEVTNDEQNFKKLMADRIDYVAADHMNASSLLKKSGLSGQVAPLSENPIRVTPLYIIFNKQKVQQEFVNEFSVKLKEFKSSQDYKILYQKYF